MITWKIRLNALATTVLVGVLGGFGFLVGVLWKAFKGGFDAGCRHFDSRCTQTTDYLDGVVARQAIKKAQRKARQKA